RATSSNSSPVSVPENVAVVHLSATPSAVKTCSPFWLPLSVVVGVLDLNTCAEAAWATTPLIAKAVTRARHNCLRSRVISVIPSCLLSCTGTRGERGGGSPPGLSSFSPGHVGGSFNQCLFDGDFARTAVDVGQTFVGAVGVFTIFDPQRGAAEAVGGEFDARH